MNTFYIGKLIWTYSASSFSAPCLPSVRARSFVSQFQRPCPWAPCSTLFFPFQRTWSLYRTVICEIGSRTYIIILGKSSPNESCAIFTENVPASFLALRTRVQIHTVLYKHTYTFWHYPHFLTPSIPAASPSLLLTLALSLLLSLSLSSSHTCSEWTAVWCSPMYHAGG